MFLVPVAEAKKIGAGQALDTCRQQAKTFEGLVAGGLNVLACEEKKAAALRDESAQAQQIGLRHRAHIAKYNQPVWPELRQSHAVAPGQTLGFVRGNGTALAGQPQPQRRV